MIPSPYQYLKHGALLCSKNFKTFVETFNFLIDFTRNISGDGDNGGAGKIQVDKSIPDRPVIRLTNGSSGSGDSSGVTAIIGDGDTSEKADGDVYVESADAGFELSTIAATATEAAKIKVDIKDRDATETDWGAHELTYTDSDGEEQTAHIFASQDIDIGGGSGALDDVVITTQSFVADVDFSATKTTSGGVVNYTLTIGTDPSEVDPSDEGGDNYCNSMSDDVTFDSSGSSGAGSTASGGNLIAEDRTNDNGISFSPCVSNSDLS